MPAGRHVRCDDRVPCPALPARRPITARGATAVALMVLLAVLPACGKPPPPAERFVHEIHPVTAADLGRSWRPGCPVAPEQLRALRLGYRNFDGRPQVGTLIAHESVADDLVEIFATLYRERFPIRAMQPVDAFDGNDDRSMAADNTSGFNCREAVAGGSRHWSTHAYGRAVDVNPVENPYLVDGRVLPPAGAGYTDRAAYRPGMAVPDGVLVRAFASAGWQWGGVWQTTPDYQHFSSGG